MTKESMYRYNSSFKEDSSGYTLGTYFRHETLEDYHGYDGRAEDDPDAPFPSSVPTIVNASSDTAQQTDISTDRGFEE